ncbi:transglutaminase-like domain-containing protein [Paenibacillus sp. BR2-3]|uniref:transglutaminase-like domain-containing protein n=1 Tax=Paenibacillus sp. BR2-3 TaxID=3048494 RepID=UPI0039773F19
MENWWTLLKSSWHRSLRLLWIMIIALQWLSYTEPLWFRETTAAVLMVLAAAVLIEIIFPARFLYRMIVEAAAVIYIVYWTIKHYGHYIPDPLLTLRERLPGLAVQMLPYLWFALGAWVLLLLSSWLISNKARILMFLGMNIAAFAALDSFTSSRLWEEVAWTVFAGMGWLVTQHLRSFQERYPRGWSYLLDYPFKVAVNIAIIFSLIIITGVNMPEVKPSLTDPYTAWMELRGTGVSSGTGTARTVSGTGAGTASAGGTTSGYSLNDGNLGGGFAFDYTPVMTVTSDLRSYMRGETRSNYSGSGWTDDDRFTRGPIAGAEVAQLLENGYTSKVKTQTLQQTVKMLGNNDYPVLFGAYSVSRVDTINGEVNSSGLFWRSRDSELLWDTDERGRKYPQNYVLTSEVPIIPVQELSAKTFEELYDGNDWEEQFLQLPADFPERVRELAREITAGAQTPYEKTALLQQYLQQTFPYTNTPDVSRGRSSDFVDSFLFEIKEGYCDYYSTAVVTMARSLDIPARWVKGYAPGEQATLPDNIAIQQGRTVNNNYTITNADAHSWAEVYFGEYGWVPVEATPGFNVPLLTKEETDSAANPLDQEDTIPQPEEKTGNAGAAQDGFPLGTWAVLASGAVLLAWAGYQLWHRRLRLRFLIQQLRNGRPLTPAQKVAAETGRWVRYLRRKGFTKEEHETLRESVEHWSRKRPSVSGNLSILLGIFEKSQYSPDVIEDKDWHSVYTEALRLRKSLRSGH